MVLEKTLKSPWEIKWVSPKGNQPWIFIGRTEAPIIWPPVDSKESTHWKRPDAGKDWRQKKKGVAENGMVREHHKSMTWIWENCGRQWRVEEPGVLLTTGSQRVRHNLATGHYHHHTLLAWSKVSTYMWWRNRNLVLWEEKRWERDGYLEVNWTQ